MKTDEAEAHRVHPRWVWGGLAVALLGAAILAIGVALLWTITSIVGAAVLCGGALMAITGGVMNDSHSQLTAQEEARQVAEGDVHEGVPPGEMLHGQVINRDAARSSARTRSVIRRANTRVPVPWAPLSGWLLFALAWFVALSQPWFIGHTATGGDTAARDGGLAIIVGLSGFRIATAQGLPRIAIGVAALAGVGFVLGGLLAAHSGRGIPIVETAFGVLTIIASVVAALSPTPPRRE